ncbi:hypothetical protein EDC04DRAFT_2598358 [Pisolithus marmoratus]|nr:hypothetical protein EDC04DRAFT_2598358 [Pisolithus marmoratus]
MECLPLKRRKLGLNSRFDRMVATMNTVHPYRRAAGALRRRARCVASSSSGCHTRNFAPKQLEKLNKGFLMRNAHGTWSAEAKESDRYTYIQTGYRIVEDVARPASCTSHLPGWMASTFGVLKPNDPLRALLPSLEVRQALTRNVPFEKVSYSSQEQQIFAFCHPETVDKSSKSNPVAGFSALSPTLSWDYKNHSTRNNTVTPSFQPARMSDFYLPMTASSPHAAPDCFVSSHNCSGVSLSSPTYCSTTEDGLSCNTAEGSSSIFDIDAIDFRWKPFFRSKDGERHLTHQRGNDTSQQMSPHSPVIETLLSDRLAPRAQSILL